MSSQKTSSDHQNSNNYMVNTSNQGVNSSQQNLEITTESKSTNILTKSIIKSLNQNNMGNALNNNHHKDYEK